MLQSRRFPNSIDVRSTSWFTRHKCWLDVDDGCGINPRRNLIEEEVSEWIELHITINSIRPSQDI